MTKDYYSTYTKGENLNALTKALAIIDTTKVKDLSRFYMIPERVIKYWARTQGLEQYIPDGDKLDFFPTENYKAMIPDPLFEETREEMARRINESIERFQSSCNHSMYFCRCGKCMKIIGSESKLPKNLIKRDDVMKTIFEITNDLMETHDVPTVREYTTRLNDVFLYA